MSSFYRIYLRHVWKEVQTLEISEETRTFRVSEGAPVQLYLLHVQGQVEGKSKEAPHGEAQGSVVSQGNGLCEIEQQ